VGDKLHGREGNNPDRPLRSPNRAQCERKLGPADSRDVGLEAATISKVRNSLPVEGPCADNERDSSAVPKRRMRSNARGRRALQAAAKGYGQRTLERLQVTMPERVDDKTGENPVRRKPKGSWGR
jgi:hypothetical protein